jgi:hypothetical protein
MRHPIESAAWFFRRGEFVLGNDVLKDECGVEYKRPGQAEYYAIYRDHSDARAINEALKSIAEMYGCLTCLASDTYTGKLTIVGEDDVISFLKYCWRVALSDEYGYDAKLKKRVLSAYISGWEEYRKWANNYILGFFEGVVGNPDGEHLPSFSKHPRILGILDGFDSINHYERKDTKC